MPEEDYRDRLIESYHSIVYSRYRLDSPDLWAWALDRIERSFGRELSELPRGARVLDLPCGVGYVEHVLLRRGFVNVDAVDGSPEQIAHAEARLRKAFGAAPGVRFHTSDASEFLEGAHGYSAIFMIDFIEHLRKDEAVAILGRAREALEPGGVIFLRTPSAEGPMSGRFYDDFTHETPFTRASLGQCVAVAGLRVDRVEFERPGYLGDRPGLVKRVRRWVHRQGQAILGRLLGVPDGGFAEAIVCVARRPRAPR